MRLIFVAMRKWQIFQCLATKTFRMFFSCRVESVHFFIFGSVKQELFPDIFVLLVKSCSIQVVDQHFLVFVCCSSFRIYDFVSIENHVS